MNMLDEQFELLLWPYANDELEREDAIAYGAWADGRLGYTNRRWREFAQANGAPDIDLKFPLGVNVWDAIPDALTPAYREGWQSALEGHTWRFDFECSSPTHFRLFHMEMLPLVAPSEDPDASPQEIAQRSGAVGVLTVNSLRIERPMDAERRVADSAYIRDGLITMCSHCRRIERTDKSGWDWIPEWLNDGPETSHGLCEACLAHYYPPEV